MKKESFDKLVVSTSTVIAWTFWKLDIEKLFACLTDCLNGEEELLGFYPFSTHHPQTEDNDINHPDLCILGIYYKNVFHRSRRAISMNFNFKKDRRCFRNALNVIYQLPHNKKINFKISKNGKFQLTGCKSEAQAFLCVSHFARYLFQPCRCCILTGGEGEQEQDGKKLPSSLRVCFQTVMTNVDHSLGFNVNRNALDEIINETKEFYSLLETSFGYTGVNIKFQCPSQWWHIPLPVLEIVCSGNSFHSIMSRCSLEDFIGNGAYREALDRLKNKVKYNTFLVFHSGKFIQSGMMKQTMENDYYRFLDFIETHQDSIREKLSFVQQN